MQSGPRHLLTLAIKPSAEEERVHTVRSRAVMEECLWFVFGQEDDLLVLSNSTDSMVDPIVVHQNQSHSFPVSHIPWFIADGSVSSSLSCICQLPF